jgi:hypothetical protein
MEVALAGKITSWSEFQQFMDDCCVKVGAKPDDSGHGRWWRSMSYQTFITDGKVKNQRIVVVGDPANSILIHSLRGDTPDFADDPNARYGRMPANANGFFADADIDEIADWILRNCPQ